MIRSRSDHAAGRPSTGAVAPLWVRQTLESQFASVAAWWSETGPDAGRNTAAGDPGAAVRLLSSALKDEGAARQVAVAELAAHFVHAETSFPAALTAVSAFRQAVGDALAPALEPSQLVIALACIQGVIDDVLALAGELVVARAEQAADVDGLTGLLNRRALERDLSRELAHSARQGRQLSVILLDLDGLKDINDSAGHGAGDAALRRLATALRTGLRAGDRAYRIGGDEFLLLLPETAAADAAAVVARVAERHPPPFSWGAATSPQDGPEMTALLEVADRRLFQRRRQARGLPPPAPAPVSAAERGGRPEWPRKPLLAALVRAVAVAGPVLLGVAAAIALARVLPRPTGVGATLGWWVAVLAVSVAVLVLGSRLAQRLLPLAMLLRLNLAFPDRAPSRFAVALRAGSTRGLERRLNTLGPGHGEVSARAAAEVLVLVTALSAHDRRTRGHCERVRAYTDLLADQIGLARDQRDRLRWAGLLHDIGKLAVSPAILNKPAALVEDEWHVIHQHPAEGARVVAPLAGWLGVWGRAVLEHHERWDGGGYPAGLTGEEISLAARIVAVADAFEVMTAPRSYKPSMTADEARAQLAAGAGTQFDPRIVRAFLNLSLGRIRWVMGPLAWLLEIPALAWFGRMPTVFGMNAAALIAAATLFGGIQLLPPSLGGPPGATSTTDRRVRAIGTTPLPAPKPVVLGEDFTRASDGAPAGSAPPTTPATSIPPGPPVSLVAASTAGGPSSAAIPAGSGPAVSPPAGLQQAPVHPSPPLTVVARTGAGHPVRIVALAGANPHGQIVAFPTHGTAHAAGPGAILYRPAAGFHGTDHLTYESCTAGHCVQVVVSIVVG